MSETGRTYRSVQMCLGDVCRARVGTCVCVSCWSVRESGDGVRDGLARGFQFDFSCLDSGRTVKVNQIRGGVFESGKIVVGGLVTVFENFWFVTVLEKVGKIVAKETVPLRISVWYLVSGVDTGWTVRLSETSRTFRKRIWVVGSCLRWEAILSLVSL